MNWDFSKCFSSRSPHERTSNGTSKKKFGTELKGRFSGRVDSYLIRSSLRVASSSSCISFFVSSRERCRGALVGLREVAGLKRPRPVSLRTSLASDSTSEPTSYSTSTTSANTEESKRSKIFKKFARLEGGTCVLRASCGGGEGVDGLAGLRRRCTFGLSGRLFHEMSSRRTAVPDLRS